jgi:hypothetical protein
VSREENARQGLTRRPSVHAPIPLPDEGQLIACQMLALPGFAGIGLLSPDSQQVAVAIWRGGASNLPLTPPALRRVVASNLPSGAAGIAKSDGRAWPPAPATVPPTMMLGPGVVRAILLAAGSLDIPEGIPELVEEALDEDGIRRWFILATATGLTIYSNHGFDLIKRRLNLA